MTKMVKRTIHLYELPNYTEGRFFISSYELENPLFPYIGNVEVEFEMPERKGKTKEEEIKEIEESIETQTRLLESLKQKKEEIEKTS